MKDGKMQIGIIHAVAGDVEGNISRAKLVEGAIVAGGALSVFPAAWLCHLFADNHPEKRQRAMELGRFIYQDTCDALIVYCEPGENITGGMKEDLSSPELRGLPAYPASGVVEVQTIAEVLVDGHKAKTDDTPAITAILERRGE